MLGSSPGDPAEQEQEGILGPTWGRKKEDDRAGSMGARHWDFSRQRKGEGVTKVMKIQAVFGEAKRP